MVDCIFCKIINGEIPSQKIYENDLLVVFKDIQPVAPTHWLIIPKQHIGNVCDPHLLDGAIPSALFAAVQEVTARFGLQENGFRVVINYGHDAGEAVPHLHLHILAGRQLGWPPG